MDPALEVDAPVDDVAGPAPSPDRRLRGGAGLLVAALLAVLAFPLVVALVQLRHPRWYPLLDMAQTEIRVRDISSGHPPLIGLAGRIGPFGPNGGSHPGPLSFYALWPVWKLFGGSSYGLFAATVFLDIWAMGLSLWMALRRGGRALLLGVALALAVLTRAYGAFLLTLPWNPYLPVLWWFVFVLAVWSVIADDFAMIPVAVVAGSMCMQTHISYLGLVGGLVAVCTALAVRAAYRRRGDPAAGRAFRRWGLVGVVTGVVLWIPPLIDQFAHSPGNLGIIRDYFSHPPSDQPPIGFGRGIGVLLAQLDPWKLLAHTLVRDSGPLEVSGSRVPGALLLILFAASVFVAWRLGRRPLVLFDTVLVVALGLGLISAARIFGTVWYYLLLWAWGLAALMLLAIVWTAVEVVRARPDVGDRPDLARAGAAVVAAATLAVSVVFAFQASDVTVQTPRLNNSLGALVAPTADALTRLERSGQHGPYLVTWLPDAEAIGSAGFGLLNELDRRGFDVRAEEPFRPGATRYHVIDARHPTLEVHLATGPDIVNWRHDSRFAQVASNDPRTDAERAEFARLHAQVVDELRRTGHGDLVGQVDDNLFMLAIAPSVPAGTRALMAQMLDLGMPMAVFVGPPGNG